MGSSISLFQFLYSFHLDRIAIAIHLSLTISVQLPNALVVSTYQPVLADVTMPSDEPEEGDKVSWNWGGGAPGGTVAKKASELNVEEKANGSGDKRKRDEAEENGDKNDDESEKKNDGLKENAEGKTVRSAGKTDKAKPAAKKQKKDEPAVTEKKKPGRPKTSEGAPAKAKKQPTPRSTEGIGSRTRSQRT